MKTRTKVDFNIRKATVPDARFIVQVEANNIQTQAQKKSLYDEILYKDYAYYYVLSIHQKPIGYLGFWRVAFNAEIIQVYVSKEYRENGYGKILLKHALKLCEQFSVQNMTLEVRPSNQAALNLYASLGFRKVAVRKQYYQDGEDAWLMTKSLGGSS